MSVELANLIRVLVLVRKTTFCARTSTCQKTANHSLKSRQNFSQTGFSYGKSEIVKTFRAKCKGLGIHFFRPKGLWYVVNYIHVHICDCINLAACRIEDLVWVPGYQSEHFSTLKHVRGKRWRSAFLYTCVYSNNTSLELFTLRGKNVPRLPTILSSVFDVK